MWHDDSYRLKKSRTVHVYLGLKVFRADIFLGNLPGISFILVEPTVTGIKVFQ